MRYNSIVGVLKAQARAVKTVLLREKSPSRCLRSRWAKKSVEILQAFFFFALSARSKRFQPPTLPPDCLGRAGGGLRPFTTRIPVRGVRSEAELCGVWGRAPPPPRTGAGG